MNGLDIDLKRKTFKKKSLENNTHKHVVQVDQGECSKMLYIGGGTSKGQHKRSMKRFIMVDEVG